MTQGFGRGFGGRVRYLAGGMAEKLADLPGAAEGPVAVGDGSRELAAADPTFVLERLGSECRSEILDARDLLREAQRAHWTLGHALIANQDAAERRRQLAAEVGELVGELIASLVAAGWSEHDAREANIPNLIWAGG